MSDSGRSEWSSATSGDALDEAIDLALRESAMDRVDSGFTERVLAAAARSEVEAPSNGRRGFGSRVASVAAAVLVFGLWAGPHETGSTPNEREVQVLAGSFLGALRTVSDAFDRVPEAEPDVGYRAQVLADSPTIRAKMEVENLVDEELLSILEP